jgi:membrane protein DedA with SNARE-associated domain
LSAGLTAGIGAIVLGSSGVISSDAAAAILSALIAYFIGETNGQKQASKPS